MVKLVYKSYGQGRIKKKKKKAPSTHCFSYSNNTLLSHAGERNSQRQIPGKKQTMEKGKLNKGIAFLV